MTPRESSALDTLRTHVTTLEAEVRERLTVVETQQKQIIQHAEDHGKTIKEIHGAIVEAEVRERLTVVETQQKQIIQQAEDHGKTIKEIHGAIVEDKAIKKALKYLISVPYVVGGIAWLFHHLTGISLPK